jgi:acyl carrier protein
LSKAGTRNHICRESEPRSREGKQTLKLEQERTWRAEAARQNTMSTSEQTLDTIMQLASAHFKVPRENLSPDEDFFQTLGIDSLQTLDLLTKLEHHFHVELPDYELQGVSDFRTLAERIQSRL